MLLLYVIQSSKFMFITSGEYRQNLCSSHDRCRPCPERLPSCVGLQDGNQVFPARSWHTDYIRCYRNRTVEVTKCRRGLFNPRTRTCMVVSQISQGVYTVNVVIFAGGKFRGNVAKTFHVGVIFAILLIFP